MSSPEHKSSSAARKSQRVLACVLCQQRKIKCDRKFPCANCIKGQVQCVPAALIPRQRRRRFPERELLDRLRRYEDLLRQHRIKFEPLHATASAADHASPSEDGKGMESADDGRSEVLGEGENPSSPRESRATKYETVNLWRAMKQASRDPGSVGDSDDVYDEDDLAESASQDSNLRETAVKKLWAELYGNNHSILFAARKPDVDLSTMHPDQVQMFRLWQIYLDNVNPLLKVTHTPTLQTRIIDAASDVSKADPNLQALMFSIYCVSLLSLDEQECQTLFKTSSTYLLSSYQFACQQALVDCRFWQTNNTDCLTALYLLLISLRHSTEPRSLSSMVGVAIRTAQHMGIHQESTYYKLTALEAELRRRLWWSLVIFDNRVSEVSNYKTTTLTPTWDCATPLNVNDSDLQPEMRNPPSSHEKPTEAIFAVIRSEMADFARRSNFHLDYVNPILKGIERSAQDEAVVESDDLDGMEKKVESSYLQFCDPDNPIHYMAIWMTRSQIAKSRLMDHYVKYSRPSVQQTDLQRDLADAYALRMLECDTQLVVSPLTKGFFWYINSYFPFPAYIHLIHDLRKRPVGEHADKAWNAMTTNYETRYVLLDIADSMFLKLFSKAVLQAWDIRERALGESDEPLEIPRIVSSVRKKVQQAAASETQEDGEMQRSSSAATSVDDFQLPMPLAFGGPSMPYSFGSRVPVGSGPIPYSGMPAQTMMDVDFSHLDWSALTWNPMSSRHW